MSPPSPHPDRRLGLALAGLIFVLLYGRFLVGFAPGGGDVVNQYLPYQELIRSAIRQGAAPLWNSFTFCGRPLMADIQVGVLYPPNWLHWVLPLPLSFALVLALHGAWMIAGCWRLGRHWRLAPPAILLGTALFCLNPFFAFKPAQGIVLFIYVGAWWPWLALAASRLAQRASFGRMAALAVTLALSLLAGAPQITFYGWLMTLAVGLIVPGRRGQAEPVPGTRINTAMKRLAWLAAAFIFALGLTAIQTAQTYHFIANSFERGAGGAGWEYITDGSLAPRLLWLLVNPGYLGLGADPSIYIGTNYDANMPHFWGAGLDYAESTFYAPLWVLCLLVPLGGWAWRSYKDNSKGNINTDYDYDSDYDSDRDREYDHQNFSRLHRRLIVAGAGAMLLGVLLALGKSSPLFEFFYRAVPGFNRFRVPARLMIFFFSGEALLAALTLHALLTRLLAGRGARVLALGGTVAGLLLVWLPFLLRQSIWGAMTDPANPAGSANPAMRGGAVINATLFDRLSQHALGTAIPVTAALLAAAWVLWYLTRPQETNVFVSQTAINNPQSTTLNPQSAIRNPHYILPWALPALVIVELILLALPFQLATYYKKYNDKYFPRTELVKLLQREHRGGRVLWLDDVIAWQFDQNQPEIYPNRLVMHGLPDARGYDPVNARWMGMWMNLLAGQEPGRNPRGFMFVSEVARPAWLTLMGVETVLSYSDLSGIPGLKAAARLKFPEGNLTLWRNEGYRGLAFAVSNPPMAENWEVALAHAAQVADNPAATPEDCVFVTDQSASGKVAAMPASAITAKPAGPNAYRYAVNFSSPALLCLAQSAYGGWMGTIDNLPAPLTTVSGAFLGLRVPAGPHDVTFSFYPEGLALGRMISLIALVSLLYGLARGRLTGTRKARP